MNTDLTPDQHRIRSAKYNSDIACEIRAETERAIQIFDGKTTCWLPRSQVDVGDDGTILGKGADMKSLCIYHGNCDDGFAAAWAVRNFLPDAEFYAGTYQKDPPNVTGRHVLMVDFSYKRPVIEEMERNALSILILDHHRTAADDLAGIYRAPPWPTWCHAVEPPALSFSARCAVLFDMERSGAGIAWDYLSEDMPRPRFIDYIEDRDLWRKQLPDGDLFTIALRSYPQDFEVWDELIAAGPGPLIAEGRSIHRYYRLRIEEMKRNAYLATLCEHPVWIVNAPYFVASDLAGELSERDDCAFAACFHQFSNGRWGYSLRSRKAIDVSEVAKKFGGGGHKNAAGFTVDAPVHVTWGAYS